MPAGKPLIAPSLLACDFARLAEEVQAVEAAGANWLHLDIMDGHFVPNITFGPPVVEKITKISTIFCDAHLMIENPDAYIPQFAAAGVDLITIHPEAGPHTHRSLQLIKSLGLKAGIALNPATPAVVVDHVLDLVDLILVMSVNPGFGGQAFLPGQLDKIKQIRDKINASGRDIALQVDGGITAQTAPAVIASGATVLVAGTAVFAAPDYGAAIAALRAGG